MRWARHEAHIKNSLYVVNRALWAFSGTLPCLCHIRANKFPIWLFEALQFAGSVTNSFAVMPCICRHGDGLMLEGCTHMKKITLSLVLAASMGLAACGGASETAETATEAGAEAVEAGAETATTAAETAVDAGKEGAAATGDAMKAGADKAGEAMKAGADKAGEAMKEGADKAVEAGKAGVEAAKEEMKK
jgi:hypothetical protein